MVEWFKAPVLKTGVGNPPPRVRIPLSPPVFRYIISEGGETVTPNALWQEFVAKFPDYNGKNYDVFSFGDKPDELLRLVLAGQKIATSCIYRGSAAQVGDISIIVDSKGDAKAVVETVRIDIVPFNQVTDAFAQKEGEGDKTLETWRRIHLSFWGNIDPDTLLECEEFRLLYQTE